MLAIRATKGATPVALRELYSLELPLPYLMPNTEGTMTFALYCNWIRSAAAIFLLSLACNSAGAEELQLTYEFELSASTGATDDEPDAAKVSHRDGVVAALGLSVRNAEGHQLVITGDSQWLAQAAYSDGFLLGYTGKVTLRPLDP